MSEPLVISRNQVRAAVAAMAQAGERLVQAQAHVSWRLKDDGTFLTDLDSEIQSLLRGPLLETFPGSVFVSEEDRFALENARSQRPRLILDPIDGTGPYARGLNCYSISLACLDSDGEPCAAIIYMPARQRWYAAACEAGGWVQYTVKMSGVRPRLCPKRDGCPSSSRCRLSDGYVYISSDAMRHLHLTGFSGRIRALGASASHLAMLLDDTHDPCAVILTQYRLWDAIAGLALARAAGLEICDLRRSKKVVHLAALVEELATGGSSPPLAVSGRATVRALLQTIQYHSKSHA